jgi:hypothetical protein
VPQSDSIFEAGKALAEEALFLSRELLPYMGSVGQFQGWSKEHRRTVGYLLTATARATESAILLCAYTQLWDAEVVTRSVLEGSLKFCYLVQQRATFELRFDEYSSLLFDIARAKDHQKALDLIEAAPDPAHPSLRPIRDRLLADDEIARIRAKNKTERRALETKWGFTGLVGELARSGDPLFRGVLGLGHAYSLASHVQHMDYVGASLPMDRDLRSNIRRDSMHMAHEARLMLDLLHFLYLRMAAGYRFVECDRAPLRLADERIKAFSEKRRSLADEWMTIEYGDLG